MRAHFIAIGGSIMHSLALEMHARGHQITGSDDEIYEPARSRLASKGLLPLELGWHPDRIQPSLDIVVLGMHARIDNPELQKALELELKIESFPEFVYNLSREKVRLVIAGSHGKTTTSGMIAHVLHYAGIPTDRMIGARIGDLEPVSLSDAGIIVLEGDEYLSSPLDPRPKFLHYHPQITVITGIAWDHMNVFPTYVSYIEPFRALITSLASSDTLIYCAEDPDLVELVESIKPVCRCIPYRTHPYVMEGDRIVIMNDERESVTLEIFGSHNLQNLKAAQLATQAIGLPSADFYRAIQSFTGASKRLQLLHHSEGRTAYLDFAHAPSKVRATVNAVREKHPGSSLIACLELHTFSSLNPAFLPQYKDTLKNADVKIVYYSPHTLASKKLPELSPDQLATFFNEPDLKVVTSVEVLERMVVEEKKNNNEVFLFMTSGRFDGMDFSCSWEEQG